MTRTYDCALAHIQEAQAADPQHKEALYGASVRAYLERMHPEASELLRLCAQAQHFERWMLPRDSYEAGRAAYLQWRRAAAQRQGQRLEQVLLSSGYESADAKRAAALVAKQVGLQDADAQALEDAACLVFLEQQLHDFAAKQGEKSIKILQKTWAKMSPAAQDLALKLPLSEQARALIERALA